MRVFVAGVSGAVGSRLLLLLLTAGHTVAGLTRTLAKADAIRLPSCSRRKEAVTQLASTNMVTIRLLPFLAIPAQGRDPCFHKHLSLIASATVSHRTASRRLHYGSRPAPGWRNL